MALATYASRKLSIAWGGFLMQDLAPDNGITFSRNSDRMEGEVGLDGNASISKLPDRSGTVTLSFQQGSTSHVILSGVAASEDVRESLVASNMIVSANDGSTLANLKGTRIMGSPEVSYGSSASGKTYNWTFFVEDMQFLAVPVGFEDGDLPASIASAVLTATSFLD